MSLISSSKRRTMTVENRDSKRGGTHKSRVSLWLTICSEATNRELIHNYRNRVGSFIKTVIMNPEDSYYASTYNLNKDNLLSGRKNPSEFTIQTNRSPK